MPARQPTLAATRLRDFDARRRRRVEQRRALLGRRIAQQPRVHAHVPQRRALGGRLDEQPLEV